MLTIKTVNEVEFVRSLDRWLANVEKEVADIGNGIAVELFNKLLHHSPQNSGDFAGNWKYSINKMDVTFEHLNLHGLDDGASFIRGNMPAIMWARAENKGKDKGYALGDTFFLSNSAEHDEMYAYKIEQGTIKFREGNYGGTIERSVMDVMPKYTLLTKSQAQKLRRKKL